MAVEKTMHLDTQVISYAMKNRWDGPLRGCSISSIVANEFLLVQSNNPSQANWYLPVLSRSRSRSFGLPSIDIRRRDHPFHKTLSDSIVMDFGNEFPSIIEYNSLSLAMVINDQLIDLFIAATKHFDKATYKRLLSRFRFLTENDIRCSALQQNDVEHAFELLARFRREHNLKGNFRNSWNDLLILSSALNSNNDLITEDNELSRFAGKLDGATTSDVNKFIELRFPNDNQVTRKPSSESKGYINVGWRVQFNRIQKTGPDRIG